MKKYYPLFFVLLFIVTLNLSSAIVCKDSFNSNDKIIQVCGYCEESNGSICSSSISCNFTIYYNNFTVFARNVTSINHNDGSFSYNITQILPTGLKNLSDGIYLGYMYCGERSKDDFSFSITTSSAISSSYGGERIISKEELNLTKSIPEDINKYFNSISYKLMPSNKRIGEIIFLILILIFIFIPEIIKIIKRYKVRKI